jgi:hypothetical protein
MADNATSRPGADVAMALTPAVTDDDEFAPTDDDMENLTEVEQAGLREFMKGDEPEDEPPAEDDAAQQAEQEAQKQAEQQRQPEPEPIQIDLTEKIQAKDVELTELRGKSQQLLDQWNDGELSEDDFNRQMTDLDQQKIALASELGGLRGMQTSLTEATAAQQRQQQQAEQQAWADACNAFQKQNPDLWSQEHVGNFNNTLKRVTQDPRVRALSDQEQLQYAAELYADEQRRFGGPLPNLATPGNANPEPPQNQAEQPAQKRREPPMTLAHVPNSASDPNQSEAATLAAQIVRAPDPDTRERLVARIPEDQFETVMSLMPD